MNKAFTTKNLLLLALFAAISIILTRFLSFYLPILAVNTVRISLGNIPVILAGLLLGPMAGAVTGIAADVIGATMFSPFGYFPGFTLSAALVGVLPGILKAYIRNLDRFKSVLLIVFITELITSVGLNTLWVSITTHVSYVVLLIPRVGITLIMMLVYASVVYVLLKRLNRELH